jgi:hypothetical protein
MNTVSADVNDDSFLCPLGQAEAMTEAVGDEREWHAVLLAAEYNRDVLEDISVDEFRYLSVYAASYSFSFDSHKGVPTRYALPILDKLNHANEEAANAVVRKVEDTFNAVAIRPIAKGEEVSMLGWALYLSHPTLAHSS